MFGFNQSINLILCLNLFANNETNSMTTKQPNICPNCDLEYNSEYKFCPHCGQESFEQSMKFRHFLKDYFAIRFNLNSKGFLSFKHLLFKPAFLTQEFVKGRHTKYISPIRLYLFISLVYFFVFSFSFPDSHDIVVENNSTELSDSKNNSRDTRIFIGDNLDLYVDSLEIETTDSTLNKFEQYIHQKSELLKTESGVNRFLENLRKNISTGMFFLLPFVALILSLIFYKKKYYLENLLFILHLQSAVFLIATFFNLIDLFYTASFLNYIQLVFFPVLTFVWIQKFYELSFGKTLWKFMLYFIAHSMLFIIYLITLLFISILLI